MRSLLFVPADSERKLARGLESGADALILDLEDSVGRVQPSNRAPARPAQFLEAHGPDRIRRYVRINPLASGLALDDLAATSAGRPDGILLPKCVPEDVRTLDHYLSAFEAAPARRSAPPASSRSPPKRRRRVRARRLWRRFAAARSDHLGCRGPRGLPRRQQPHNRRRLRRPIQTGALAVPAGGGRGRCRRDRHDLHRFPRRGRSQGRMRGGAALRVRRENGDPPGAARPRSTRRSRSAPPSATGPSASSRCSQPTRTPAPWRSTAR